MDLLLPLLLFGAAGALLGLFAGAIVGINRYREALGLGAVAGLAASALGGILSSGEGKWQWIAAYFFFNLLSYAVFLGLGCAVRGLLTELRLLKLARYGFAEELSRPGADCFRSGRR